MEETVNICCPGCGGTRHRDLGELRTPVETMEPHPESLRAMVSQTIPSRLMKCHECSLVFRERSLTSSELRTLYENLPEKNWNYQPESVGSWKAAKRELLRLYAGQQSIRILDIGAFDGTFLSQLPATWQKHAVEPSTSTAETLKIRGIRRIAEFLEDPSLETELGKFDCITLLDVFEHLPNPQAAFNRIASLLKPGGTLLVSTGNSDHWTLRLLKGRHWYFHSIQHLCVPCLQVLRRYATLTNLRLLVCVHHSHQLRGAAERFDQFVETVYWYLRLKCIWVRWVATLIQQLPRYHHLLHRADSTKCDALHDHFLVVLQKLPLSP